MDLVFNAIRGALPPQILSYEDRSLLCQIVYPILNQDWSAFSKLRKSQTLLRISVYHIAPGKVVCSLGPIGKGHRITTRMAVCIEKVREETFVAYCFAEKRLNKKYQNERSFTQILRQYMFLKTLDHPHIFSPKRVVAFLRGRAFNYSFLEELGIDLLSYLAKVKASPSPRGIRRIFICIIQAMYGLEHLHQNGFIHRDFKLENILVFNSTPGGAVAKLDDFEFVCKEADLLKKRKTTWDKMKQSFDEAVHEQLKREVGVALEPSLAQYEFAIRSHPSPSILDRSKIDDVMLYLSEWNCQLKKNSSVKGTLPIGEYKGNIAPETIEMNLTVKASDLFGVGAAIEEVKNFLVFKDAQFVSSIDKLCQRLMNPNHRERGSLDSAAMQLQRILI